MSVVAVESGNVVTLQLDGRFDFSTHQEFLNSCHLYPRGQKQFVVDLAGVDYMDSSALGMLLQLREQADKGQPVALINARSEVREILRIANFDKLFAIA